MRFHQQCRQQSNLPESAITNAIMGNFDYNPQLAQHLLCMSRAMGFQDENGRINREAIREKLSLVITDENTVNNAVNQCAVQQATPEKTAFRAAECFFTNLRKVVMGM